MENMGEQINIVLNEIAAKLGVASEYIYPILIRQARIEGVIGLIIMVISVTMFLLVLRKYFKTDFSNDDDGTSRFIMICILIGVTTVMFFIISAYLTSTLTALLNPEWYVFSNILKELIR